MLKKIKNIVLDTLFPIKCLRCGNNDVWFCEKCLEKIKIISCQVCPYCEKNNVPSGKICEKCKEKFLRNNKTAPLDNLVLATTYKESGIFRLIHFFKYRFISDLSDPLGKILVRAVSENNLPLPDLIISIPLHKRRERWRGFNQAELLANYVSHNLAPGFEIPVVSGIIVRKKFTTPQMKIKNYSERKKNLQNAFVLNKEKIDLVKNKKILLIDDVATTGSTLFECGRLLRSSEASKIFACVVARQEWKSVL